MQKLTRIVTLSVALLMISGCSYFGVYKRDLPQGNLVTEAMVEQLQPGMSRQQVVDLMGSPLLEAPFDASQWDYVYRLDEAYGGVEQRRVTLTFQGERLAGIDREGNISGDIQLPDDQGAGPSVEGSGPATQPTTPDGGVTTPQGGETSADSL
ncbi:outer membrane protein assembly factor BamE [Halomonas sp. LR5S13]|uniref:outer membrane protein assembly factor BamE n=1 Tax=Halomonas rhizosphaerae TaxID=3043296 RepID=UPI0024A87B7D|nr:outer membrane protein assembly factor BamE [Halomonas rhizosphaerae]MDI5920274.1 outer membrane protein assembly factor BamE [Halomonas rhizosphaerae]